MKLDIILAKALINLPVASESYNSKKAWNNPLSELPTYALSIIPLNNSLSLIII